MNSQNSWKFGFSFQIKVFKKLAGSQNGSKIAENEAVKNCSTLAGI